MSFLELELESSIAPLLVKCRLSPGEAWYSNVQVPSDFLQVSSKRCVSIRLCKLVPRVRHPKEYKMERSQKWVEKSDLCLILVVVSYIQRVLWYHLLATRPQTVKSLCFSLIPGSVMLTHTVLEWIYNGVAITHLLHRISQKRTYYNK